MTILQEKLLGILKRATEPLYVSDITAQVNQELGEEAYWPMDIAKALEGLSDRVTRLPDGRWKLV